jgi:hypothetical protein
MANQYEYRDKDYPVPHLTEEERLAKGQKFLRMLAQSNQQAMERERLRSIPIQAGTDSVN